MKNFALKYINMCVHMCARSDYITFPRNSILYIVTIFWQCYKIRKIKWDLFKSHCLLQIFEWNIPEGSFRLIVKINVKNRWFYSHNVLGNNATILNNAQFFYCTIFPFLKLCGWSFTRQMIAMMRLYRFFILMVWCADSMIYDNAVIGKSKILLCRSLKFCA